MKDLNDLLHQLGISKVKLAKFLGVSRQMIYNYLEIDDVNKWPKDKKVLLFNLLGIKSKDDMKNIKVTTDYIQEVEMRLNSLNNKVDDISDDIFEGLDDKQKDVLNKVIDLLKEYFECDNGIKIGEYLYYFLQALNTNVELKYILGYVAKETGFIKASEYAFNEDGQYIFESIMFSAMVLFHSGKASKNRLIESHRRFESHIEHKLEDKMSRTMELNNIKQQALKELGINEINENNASIVFAKIAEIQSRNNAF